MNKCIFRLIFILNTINTAPNIAGFEIRTIFFPVVTVIQLFSYTNYTILINFDHISHCFPRFIYILIAKILETLSSYSFTIFLPF